MVVDLDLLKEKYSEESYKTLRSSLRILADMGFFDLIVVTNKEVILGSFDSEDASVLAGKILEIRQTNRVLLALRDLAQAQENEGNQ